MLKCKLVPSIVMLNVCVKLCQNQSIKKGLEAMTKYFLNIATTTLTLILKFWIRKLSKILSHLIFM